MHSYSHETLKCKLYLLQTDTRVDHRRGGAKRPSTWRGWQGDESWQSSRRWHREVIVSRSWRINIVGSEVSDCRRTRTRFQYPLGKPLEAKPSELLEDSLIRVCSTLFGSTSAGLRLRYFAALVSLRETTSESSTLFQSVTLYVSIPDLPVPSIWTIVLKSPPWFHCSVVPEWPPFDSTPQRSCPFERLPGAHVPKTYSSEITVSPIPRRNRRKSAVENVS